MASARRIFAEATLIAVTHDVRDTDAFERVVSLTGALEERTPPRVVELAPPQAAAEILRQLHRWGYLTDAGAAGAEATAAKATGSEPTDPVTAEPRP